MSKKVRCNCEGWPDCQLCKGTKFYGYEPGPRGWLPFRCPTCKGEKQALVNGKRDEPCPTCKAFGVVDPASPPSGGWFDTIFKIFFGA